MNRFRNNGISIFFTESHEILPNSVYGMYEIPIGINRIILYSNWNLQQTDRIKILNGKELKNST